MARRNKRLTVVVCLTIAGLISGGGTGAQDTPVPSPWLSRDIGSPAIAGASSFDQTSGTFSIDAAGSDIWGTADQFHFVYQPLAGDAVITARVDSLFAADEWSKAGVMIRSSLTANAAHALAHVSASRGAVFQRRPSVGDISVATADATTTRAPLWLRLARSGSTVTAFMSSDGTSWTTMGSDTIALDATAYVGLAVTSHNVAQSTSAAVSAVTVTTTALPSPQKSQDIGSPSIAGTAAFSDGTYTVTSASRNIGGTADQFHYVYQPVTGDVDVSVRVASLAGVTPRAKAGVMIRESLTAGSVHAFAGLSNERGFLFQRRPVAGGTGQTTAVDGATPGWLRLKRTGDLITAYRSLDGVTWTAIGSDSLPMTDTVYVGIAVTSRDVLAETTATLTNLTIDQSLPPNQPPTATLTSPANGASFTAPATIALTASAADADGSVTRVDFYNGSTLLGSDTTAPYTFGWTNVAAGTYALKATAVDNAGASGSSSVASITVTAPANQPPTVTLTAPANGATYTAPATIALAASASDPENQLNRVEFYSGTTLLGTDAAAPYTFTWSAVPAGTYALKAVAYDAGGLTGTTAAAVSVTVAASSALPPGQQAADIGAPAIAGSTTYSSGSYQIHAGGADIWNTADQFHYVYQQMSGDIDVSARIVSQSFSDEWAKAGVMIRVALDAPSANVATTLSAGRSYAFQRRLTSGAPTVATNVTTGPDPGWVRLTRTGAVVTAYRSSDGQTWTVIGSDSIDMPDAVYVGIAVTSHNTTVATDAVVDNFRATAMAPANQPPAVSLTAPPNGATYTAPASLTLTANAADADGSVARVEFYNGAALLGTDTTAPYAFAWSGVAAGTYALRAIAYDNVGASATSATATITVGAASTPPTAVVFQASVDHAIVTSYRLEIFANGADPNTATPVAASDLGKPTPDAIGDITVNRATLFSALPAGTYVLTVSSIAPEGSSRSEPITFIR